jgi:hypothetical protein
MGKIATSKAALRFAGSLRSLATTFTPCSLSFLAASWGGAGYIAEFVGRIFGEGGSHRSALHSCRSCDDD